ncbi:MAG: NmrA family NAD(P)-binding protein [Hydrogenophaga sp.]|uniref:NmrA family NAD(P)-binding protein n=1 Tax=Hydrogenophaga sp. TaxID=1904254 RepID=UPI002727B227|nr:NmrA family NAD(P)-binding protein [Hydrogenophaga sp.]MDO9570133.1 NmrA family NAD(P)-binding protein [Hydrogenophaga sp.]
MSVPYNRKPIPRSILIFGASGTLGGPLARFLQREAPQIRLRLASSREEGCEALRRDFPGVDVVQADYYDLPTLEVAVQGMEGLFVNTTLPKDEQTAMSNLIAAVKKAHCAVHIIRAGLGMQPEANEHRVPEDMRDFIAGDRIAKRLLDESGLPVTYFNFGASFTENLLTMKAGLIRERKLIWHNRKVPHMDKRDIAEAAGRILLSDNHRHIGQFHTLNNGQDLLNYAQIADLMTQVWGEKITFEGSKEAVISEYMDSYGTIFPKLWDFFQMEQDNEEVWALNDFMERTLGRKPISLREWLRENKRELLGLDASQAATAPAATTAPTATAPVPGAAPAAAAASSDEVWDCVIATPIGKVPYELVVRRAGGGTWTGTMKDLKSGADLPVRDGKINGSTMTWGSELTKPFKMKLKIEVQVQGKELSGQASAGMMGKSAMQGTLRGA